MKEGFDVGFEMSGSAPAFQEMLASMSHGGKIAMLGPPAENFGIDWSHLVMNMITIKGIYGRQMFETWYWMSVLVHCGRRHLARDHPPLCRHELRRGLRGDAGRRVRQGRPYVVGSLIGGHACSPRFARRSVPSSRRSARRASSSPSASSSPRSRPRSRWPAAPRSSTSAPTIISAWPTTPACARGQGRARPLGLRHGERALHLRDPRGAQGTRTAPRHVSRDGRHDPLLVDNSEY